jgi:hypothetical protein
MKGNNNAILAMKANMNLSYHENARMKHDDEAMDA